MRHSNFVLLVLAPTAAAAGCTTADPPVALRNRTTVAAGPAAGIEGVKPMVRPTTPPPEHRRNPFTFAAVDAAPSRTAAMRPLPPPEGLPELPLPVRRPTIRLLGITTGRETPPVRTAVLSVDGDLVLARVGETVAGRFRVDGISDDAVELVDGVVQEHLRLPLS